MADDELDVVVAGGATKKLRSIELPGTPSRFGQAVFLAEWPEAPVSPAGGTVRYTVDNSPAVALDPPTAAAKYARVRVYESTQSATLRLYYRSDGTNPTTDGANAFGFLLHGELILVKIADPTNFRMIAEGAGIFAVYVEWLNPL